MILISISTTIWVDNYIAILIILINMIIIFYTHPVTKIRYIIIIIILK